MEDLRAFDAYARALSADVLRVLVPIIALVIVIWWPFDLVIYGDRASRMEMAVWRAALLAMLGSIYMAARASAWVRGRAPVTIALGLLAGFGGSSVFAVGIPLRTSFVPILYTAPFATLIVVLPLARRAWVVALMVAACVAPVLLVPGAVPSPGTYVAAMLASGAFALSLGHTAYSLLRQNFFQQRAIERTAEQLAAIDRTKDEFFANISHELRTPLTLILASLRTLGGSPDPGAASAAVLSGQRSTRRLLLLVNEILDLARIESGRRAPKLSAIDLAVVLRRIVAEFDVSFDGRATVTLAGAGQSTMIAGDPDGLDRVFYNLVSNAVKFADPEAPVVEVRLSSARGEVTVAVRDNGIGIADADRDRIFERFVRIESTATRGYAGTGIGLALVRAVVHEAGGRVDVSSEVGKGSTFTVTLPRGDVANAAQAAPPPDDETDDERAQAPRAGLSAGGFVADARSLGGAAPPSEMSSDPADERPHVLLVEDNADLRRYIRRVLSTRYRVDTARDGAEALAAARKVRPELVVTDVMMPRMGGPELLAALRRDGALRDLPVVYLTARAGTEARAEALEGGADDYVCKPFEERELLARIDNLLLRARQARALAGMNEALEARVAERTLELRSLAAHLSEVLELERARIARDIHDELGQTLTALRLDLDHLARLGQRGESRPGELASTLARASGLVGSVLKSSRRILTELRPPGLDELGLLAAVEQLAAEFRARHGIACEVSLDPDFDADPKRATGLFRILQESLNNVVKHARAKKVEIALAVDGRLIRLVVRDDGAGLARAPVRAGAMGLLGMRERVAQFGGTVTVTGQPGQGTTVYAEIPLDYPPPVGTEPEAP